LENPGDLPWWKKKTDDKINIEVEFQLDNGSYIKTNISVEVNIN